MKNETITLLVNLNQIEGGIEALSRNRAVVVELLVDRIDEYKKACGFDSATQDVKVFWRQLETEISLGGEATLLMKLHDISASVQDFVTLIREGGGSVDRAFEMLTSKSSSISGMPASSLN